jgi:hypothetical protein
MSESVGMHRRGRRRRWFAVPVAGVTAAGLAFALTGTASAAVQENWAASSPLFRTTHGATSLVSVSGPNDGRALRLTLPARPGAGPGGGPEIATNAATYRYGTYGTRMKMADCTGLGRVGVVTGTFTYSTDHGDANGNGLPDNAEIDIEVLCAQPHVLWLTIWTDYRDADAAARKISRAIDMRTGKVLYNCYVHKLGDPCQPAQPGENNPAGVTPIPNYNSGTQYRTYMFDWQPNRVTFWGFDDSGRKNVLWDYTGPASRIPTKAGMFMQNVWHTNNWDPLDGPGRTQPTTPINAYVDTTFVP